MALILDHFYSAALTECNSLTAIVPMENNEKSSYPVLWLLPPAGCDHTAWQRPYSCRGIWQMNWALSL